MRVLALITTYKFINSQRMDERSFSFASRVPGVLSRPRFEKKRQSNCLEIGRFLTHIDQLFLSHAAPRPQA